MTDQAEPTTVEAEQVYTVDRDGNPAARIIRRSGRSRPFAVDGLKDGLSQDEFWRFAALVREAQVDHFNHETEGL